MFIYIYIIILILNKTMHPTYLNLNEHEVVFLNMFEVMIIIIIT